jgi:hypothetical protein
LSLLAAATLVVLLVGGGATRSWSRFLLSSDQGSLLLLTYLALTQLQVACAGRATGISGWLTWLLGIEWIILFGAGGWRGTHAVGVPG